MKIEKVYYVCDRCGSEMETPYVEISPQIHNPAWSNSKEFHYCYSCWTNRIYPYLLKVKEKKE